MNHLGGRKEDQGLRLSHRVLDALPGDGFGRCPDIAVFHSLQCESGVFHDFVLDQGEHLLQRSRTGGYRGGPMGPGERSWEDSYCGLEHYASRLGMICRRLAPWIAAKIKPFPGDFPWEKGGSTGGMAGGASSASGHQGLFFSGMSSLSVPKVAILWAIGITTEKGIHLFPPGRSLYAKYLPRKVCSAGKMPAPRWGGLLACPNFSG